MQNQTEHQSEMANVAIAVVKGQEPVNAPPLTDANPMRDRDEARVRNAILELLDKPGAHIGHDGMIDTVMNQWPCEHSADETLDVVLDALDALVDEKQLARVVTCVVLTDLPAPAAVERIDQHGDLTVDEVREAILEALPNWPGAAQDEGTLFTRLNHTFNCQECAHEPESIAAFNKLFCDAVDMLVDEGVIARVVTYVRLSERPAEEDE